MFEKFPFNKSDFVLPISAGLSGMVEATSTHPIDRIKTEMQQLMLNNKKSSIIIAGRSIYTSSGIGGFYLGILPRILGIVPMRIIYWSTMVKMNKYVKNQPTIIKYFVPGLVAGSIQTIADNPIEVAKIQLMTRGKNKSKSLNVFTLSGLQNLYTGFVPTLARNSIFAVCVAGIVNKFGQKKENKFAAGAIGGLVGSILSQPFDVVKTEVQRYKNVSDELVTKKKSTIRVMADIAKINPLQLWAGGSMRCTLAFLNMGIGFCALAYIQDMVKQIIY